MWHKRCHIQSSVRKTLNEYKMAKQVITVAGEQMNVREDTAKAYRGTYWALLSVAAFILITAVLFFGGFLAWLTGPSQVTPATSGQSQDNMRR